MPQRRVSGGLPVKNVDDAKPFAYQQHVRRIATVALEVCNMFVAPDGEWAFPFRDGERFVDLIEALDQYAGRFDDAGGAAPPVQYDIAPPSLGHRLVVVEVVQGTASGCLGPRQDQRQQRVGKLGGITELKRHGIFKRSGRGRGRLHCGVLTLSGGRDAVLVRMRVGVDRIIMETHPTGNSMSAF